MKCFDDLGAEQSLKYYGNECNIMAEILLSRYDIFIAQDMLTHITTNLSASEIENGYGSRVRSRMREIFNLISFNSSSSLLFFFCGIARPGFVSRWVIRLFFSFVMLTV
jgi:hypothetical protein